MTHTPEDLQRIKSFWEQAIERAREAKKTFNEDASTILSYFAKDHSKLYEGYQSQGFWKAATINKTFELVKIFGPALYEQSPYRVVTGSQPDDPFPETLQKVLNYTVRELDLRRHARQGIDEALIKGQGVLWTEVDRRTGLQYSHWMSCDDLLIDPDARSFEDRWWIARVQRTPLWEFRRRFGQAAEGIRPSGASKEEATAGPEEKKEGEQTKDLVTYWEIYSQMGDGIAAHRDDNDPKTYAPVDDNVMIVLVPGQRVVRVGPWPTPFWADVRTMGWPCSLLEFAREPNAVWPVPLLKPALPIQKWIDWAYSFLLRKVQTSTRDIIVAPKRLTESQKAVIRNDSQADLEIMYVDDSQLQDVKKIFEVLNFGQMNGDLLRAIQMAEEQFAKITGLNEILYGSTPQAFRSAKEADVKDRNSRLRIDDMGREVVEWNNVAARHEAICGRWHVSAEKIAQCLGPQAGEVWGAYKTGDINRLMREYEYSIESGSMRPVGPQEMREDSMLALQTLAPIYGQAMAWAPLNRLIYDWAKARQMPKPEELQIPVSPLNGQMASPAQQQQAEEQRRMAEQQQLEAAKQQAMQEGLEDADSMVKLKIAQEDNAAKMGVAQLKARTDMMKVQMQSQTQVKVAASRPRPMGGK